MQAITATPDDDLARLAFADWLEENDRAQRARFIRLQIKAARLPAWSLARRRLERAAEAYQVDSWDAELREFSPELYCYRRGIAEGVRMWARDFLEHWPEVRRLAPIRRVDLDVKSRAPIEDVAASPYLLEISELNFSNQQ